MIYYLHINYTEGIAIILIRYPRIRLIRGYRTIRAYDVILTTILIVLFDNNYNLLSPLSLSPIININGYIT